MLIDDLKSSKSQIKHIRNVLGLSRSDVAKEMKRSVRIIERIERGEREVRISEAVEYAVIYNMSLEDISLACDNKLSKIKFKNKKCPKKMINKD